MTENEDTSPENLRKFLESDDIETIKTGIMLADEAGIGDKAIEILCEPLRDTDEDVRWSAMETLREVGDARAVEEAVDAGIKNLEGYWDLYTNGWPFGCSSVSALAAFDNPRVIDCLIRNAAWACWNDEDEFPPDHETGHDIHDFLEACTSALVPKYSSALLESMMDEMLFEINPWSTDNPVDGILDNAFLAGSLLQDIERNSPGLVAETVLEGRVLNAEPQSLAEGNDWANLYSWTVDQVGWKPDTEELRVAYLITKRDWKSLVELGVPAVELLIRMLSADDGCGGAIQCGATKALGKIGDARAVKPLTELLDKLRLRAKSYEVDVREAAKKALKKLGHEVE